MAYGLQILNSSGDSLFDSEDLQNLLVQTGTVNVPRSDASPNYLDVVVSNMVDNGRWKVFLGENGYQGYLLRIEVTINTGYFRIRSLGTGSGTIDNVQYLVFVS